MTREPDALDRFLTFCLWFAGVGIVLSTVNLVVKWLL